MKIPIDLTNWTKLPDGTWRHLRPDGGYRYFLERHCSGCGSLFLARKDAPVGEYCSYPCSNPHNSPLLGGADHPQWKGGRKTDKDGYVWILDHNHPNADKKGYVAEHRLIMSTCIGRPIASEEVVHHKNADRQDNRLENLVLMPRSEHMSLHIREYYATRETL